MKKTKNEPLEENGSQSPSLLGKAKLRLEQWTHYHFATEKIDFMSVNRLRQNLTATSTLPQITPCALQSRSVAAQLQAYLSDPSITFEHMKLIVNPYGRTPLSAVAIFHTDTPCFATYTVSGVHTRHNYMKQETEADTAHFVPILGLYPDRNNTITFTLVAEDSTVLATKSCTITTQALADTHSHSYPIRLDEAGYIRYILMMDANEMGLVSLANGRYMLAEKNPVVPTFGEPQSVLLHELDVLGGVYHTYYIAGGIHDALWEKEPGGNLLVLSNSFFRHMNDTVLEINRQTGAVSKSWDFRSNFDISMQDKSDWIHLNTIAYSPTDNALVVHAKELNTDYVFDYSNGHLKTKISSKQTNTRISSDLLVQLSLPGKQSLVDMEETAYSQVGWLSTPKLYKGASVETIGAQDLDTLWTKYALRFTLSGDLLLIETDKTRIQEILFVKRDRIYQLDASEILQTRNVTWTKCHQIAIPFTEMYSGTYSIVLRFSDGGQEVLQDTITLSRTREISPSRISST